MTFFRSTDEVEQILDIAEQSMRETVQELNLRAKVFIDNQIYL